MPRHTAYLIHYFTDSRNAVSETFGYMYTIDEPGSADLFSQHVRSIKQTPHFTLILIFADGVFLVTSLSRGPSNVEI